MREQNKLFHVATFVFFYVFFVSVELWKIIKEHYKSDGGTSAAVISI